ncbi:MAG: ferredoxin [Candidatus Paceibacterota bacterium]
MSKKITVDDELCIGCGACVNLCPKVFALQEDGKSRVIDETGAGCDADVAANSCPVGAIKVSEE